MAFEFALRFMPWFIMEIMVATKVSFRKANAHGLQTGLTNYSEAKT